MPRWSGPAQATNRRLPFVVREHAAKEIRAELEFASEFDAAVEKYRAEKRGEYSDPARDKQAAIDFADDPRSWGEYFLPHYFRTKFEVDGEVVFRYTP